MYIYIYIYIYICIYIYIYIRLNKTSLSQKVLFSVATNILSNVNKDIKVY